jgi:hypothetical protein
MNELVGALFHIAAVLTKIQKNHNYNHGWNNSQFPNPVEDYDLQSIRVAIDALTQLIKESQDV